MRTPVAHIVLALALGAVVETRLPGVDAAMKALVSIETWCTRHATRIVVVAVIAFAFLIGFACGRGPAPCNPVATDADRSNSDKRCEVRR